MCFSVTAGPGGYGTLTSGFSTVITTLVLTTTTFGQTASGTPAYLITAATGQRVYVTPSGTNITVPVQLAGINAGMHAFPADYIPGNLAGLASDNVYYPQFANLDGYGIQLRGNRDIVISQDADTHSSVSRVFWSGVDWEEQDIDGVTYPGYVYIYGEYSGNALFTPYTGQDVSPTGAFAQQCLASYGSQVTFSFCYSISTPTYSSYAYGLALVNGPQQRENRVAYEVQGMTGVRTITMSNGTTQSINIINVQYLNEDTFVYNGRAYVFLSDNLIFASGAPELSRLGLGFNLSSKPLFGQAYTEGGSNAGIGLQGSTNLILSTDGLSSGNNFYEAVGGASGNLEYSSTYQWKTAAYTPGGSLVSCASTTPAVAIPAPPTLQTYSFCYAFNGPQSYGYQIVVSGTVLVYSTAVTTAPGGVGYGVANVTGTRAYSDGMGRSYTSVISGLSQDWVAGQQGWSFDQLFYPSMPSGSPVDGVGILYSYSGFLGANSNPAATNYDRVVRLFSNATSAAVEEYYNTNGTIFTPFYTVNNAKVQTGAAGAVTASTCVALLPSNGYNGPAYVPSASTGASGNSNSSSNNVGGGSSSSSSLSNGAIAGIVIGVCAGAALFCVICFFLGAITRGGKGKGEESTTSKYNSQVDASRVGQSQVEMHPVEVSSVRPMGEEEVVTA